MIRVRYFASLREALNSPGETLELPATVANVADLARYLAERGEIWRRAFGGARILLAAVNQQSAKGETPIQAGDEVAFFPPVTGG